MKKFQFLSDLKLVQAWREERAKNTILQLVEQVAEKEAPYSTPTLSHATEADALIAYGYAQGWAARGRLYEELATLPIVTADPTKRRSTYGVKKTEEQPV